MKEKGTLKNDTIVGTVMSNLGLTMMGREKGISIEQAALATVTFWNV